MSALLAHFVVTSVLDVMEMCIGPIIDHNLFVLKCRTVDTLTRLGIGYNIN